MSAAAPLARNRDPRSASRPSFESCTAFAEKTSEAVI
jgi:hypothetical protein